MFIIEHNQGFSKFQYAVCFEPVFWGPNNQCGSCPFFRLEVNEETLPPNRQELFQLMGTGLHQLKGALQMQVKLLGIFALLLTLTGCVTPPQPPVSLNAEFLTASDNRIGVAMDTMPSPNLQLPGANCLLCIAVASGANSELSAHAKTLSTEELAQLKAEVLAVLKEQGRNVILVDDPLLINKLPKTKGLGEGFAKRDFSSFAEQHGLDHLLVIDINGIGMTRPYTSYIPMGAPQATVSGTAFLIDLQSNKYEWYLPIDLHLGTEGEWDEPKDFPGLTNSYYQVLESLRDRVLSPLTIQAPIAQITE